MFDAAEQLFANFAILCSGAVVLFILATRATADFSDRRERAFLGLALGMISFMVVMDPIEGSLGTSFDTRAAPVIMASFWGGPISGLIAASIGAVARYLVGGAGAAGGVLSLFVYAAAGLLAARFAPRRRRLGLVGWAVVGAAASLLATPTFFVGRAYETGLAILGAHWQILLAGNVGGVTVLGLLMEQMRVVVDRTRARAHELENAYKAQKHITQEMERLLYAVTHDLKGPIVTVRGFAGLIDRAFATGDLDTVKDGVGRILRASARLSTMTDGLMNYGSLSARPAPTVSIDLADLIPRACEMLSAKIEGAGARISTVTPLPEVWGPQDDILRVVLNLIGNAVDHGCPRPGMTVEVGVERSDEGWVLSVADHGPGIEETFRTEVFRLFRRLGRQESPGAGLGLAIVEKIMQGIGGWCVLSQTPGGGATVRALIAPAAPATVLLRKEAVA